MNFFLMAGVPGSWSIIPNNNCFLTNREQSTETYYNNNMQSTSNKRWRDDEPPSCCDVAARMDDYDESIMPHPPMLPSIGSSLKKARSVDFGRLRLIASQTTGETASLSAVASQFSRRAARGVYNHGYVLVLVSSSHHGDGPSSHKPVSHGPAACEPFAWVSEGCVGPHVKVYWYSPSYSKFLECEVSDSRWCLDFLSDVLPWEMHHHHFRRATHRRMDV